MLLKMLKDGKLTAGVVTRNKQDDKTEPNDAEDEEGNRGAAALPPHIKKLVENSKLGGVDSQVNFFYSITDNECNY